MTSVHSSDCLHLAVIFLLTNSMAADTASTSENSPSHRLHPQNSLSSPETPEPKAKRLKTDSDVIVHQIDHHSFQTDACSIHLSSKSIPVCVAQPIRREKMKLSEDVNFRTKVAHSDDTDVGSEKHKHSSVHVESVPLGSKEECIGLCTQLCLTHASIYDFTKDSFSLSCQCSVHLCEYMCYACLLEH